MAAYTGKLEICKIIIENVVDLSCLDEKYRGQTPFEYARSHNQLEICYYFNEVRNQSTFDIGWRFHKNIGTCFPEMSESRAITATTTATSTATTTETTSFWSLFWNKYMKNWYPSFSYEKYEKIVCVVKKMKYIQPKLMCE